MRILRVYHAGRDPAHRARDRALVRAGAQVVLVVPFSWPDGGAQDALSTEPFEMVELPVLHAGDVNRHRYRDRPSLADIVRRFRPDLLDLHEEPFSSVCRQWLTAARDVPVVSYTAQNVDKRLPPPFQQYEQLAFHRLRGLYPCSRQAASVARGRGFDGLVRVLPLGIDAGLLVPGMQRLDDGELVLGLVGRLVPEKGALEAVSVLQAVHRERPARLLVVGDGPLAGAVIAKARSCGLEDRLELVPWQPAAEMATLYRRMHVVLVPSKSTQRWVEQFGRVAVEAQASGAVVAGFGSGALPEAAGEEALLVREGDVTGLEQGILRLLADATDYRRRRRAGIHRAHMHNWDAVVADQLSLYEQVLASPMRPLGPPRSRTERRREAVAEFGPTAQLAGGAQRPFAVPVLRRNQAWTRALGRVVDRVWR